MDLKNDLESGCPNAVVSGFVGREGSFEVSINGKQIFSKLETFGFPYPNDLIEAMKTAQNGEEVAAINNSQSPCTIL
ncbi:migration and invasion enhancer 1 [Ciona intestinalis]|uniref:Migration and invasion enhancer 1 n=1 Tax=Ciona intestinalis TaxID=7719 RepID=H2XU83_CIOIN|nr:migration and invasion enhancer 1 [Ciona intestinalis]|eukprot:XP_004225523.1 migration and invasion enhancer 1 [Ciona intestinalis]